MPGICTSSRTTSGGCMAIASSASWPDAAVTMSKPRGRSTASSSRTFAGVSSTTRMRGRSVIEPSRDQLRRTLLGGEGEGQTHGERAPPARLAVHGDVATMEGHQALRQGETDAGSGRSAAGSADVERLEDAFTLVGRDADAGVVYRELERVVHDGRPHGDESTGFGEVHAVGDELADRLLEPH